MESNQKQKGNSVMGINLNSESGLTAYKVTNRVIRLMAEKLLKCS